MFIFLGRVAIYFLCRFTIRKSTLPLQDLSKSVDEVAKGNFNAPLPVIPHNDEIRQLRDSFSNMQQSLRQYINDLKATTAEKASIESELTIARQIQMAMLPAFASCSASFPAYTLYASLTPAKAVGGDFYDYFQHANRLYFCVGDVSGKGVPAALVMTMACSAFRLLAENETEPERIVMRMNDNMTGHSDLEAFITLFVGIFDLDTGRLCYCNAGHKKPYINGQPLHVERNLPVGAMPYWEFKAQETILASGSMLFVYTDGLTEAEDVNRQLFGEGRMKQQLKTSGDDPQRLVESMERAVHEFVGNTEQSDDLTMFALRYSPPSSHHHPPFTLTLPCDVSQTERLGELMEQICEQAGIDNASATKLNIAVEEAVVNVMNYAYPPDADGEVRIDAFIADNLLTIIISDRGRPFDPTTASPADTSLDADARPIGGLGIHLMHRYTDGVSYERRDGCNILTLVKRLNQSSNILNKV